MEGPYCCQELRSAHGLEHVTARTGGECGEDLFFVETEGQDEDLGRPTKPADRLREAAVPGYQGGIDDRDINR